MEEWEGEGAEDSYFVNEVIDKRLYRISDAFFLELEVFISSNRTLTVFSHAVLLVMCYIKFHIQPKQSYSNVNNVT